MRREGVTQYIAPADNTQVEMAENVELPALRSTRYPDLAITISSQRVELQAPIINVLDLASGVVYRNAAAMINKNFPYFDMYNFNAKLQALSGCADKGYAFGNVIIFGNDYIFMNDNHASTTNPEKYRIIKADGQTDVVFMPTSSSQLSNVKTTFEPLFDPNDPDRVFIGLYSFLRGTDLVFHRHTHDGKVYIIFGNDGVSWSNVWRPHFVISSDVLS
jgi:hypothetical protein